MIAKRKDLKINELKVKIRFRLLTLKKRKNQSKCGQYPV